MAKTKKVLSRDVLLTPKMELTYLPDRDGYVWVKALDALDYLQYNTYLENLRETEPLPRKQTVKALAYMTSLCVCDENGNLLYSTKDEDVEKLTKNSMSTLIIITGVAMRLAGFQKKVIEEARKELTHVETSLDNSVQS